MSNSILTRMMKNSLNIVWIAIEHIINVLTLITVMLIITIVFSVYTGESSIWSVVLIGVLSGITASILVQATIDLRDCRKDAFKLIDSWNQFYYSDYGSPIYVDSSNKKDIVSHINNKYKDISNINNIISNKYSFEVFECKVDKVICRFISKLEVQLGPYRENSDAVLYAYAVFCYLCSSTYGRDDNSYTYVSAIGHIIWACVNTHTPIFREHFIYKKTGIKSKRDFYTVIEYIEHMNNKVFKNMHDSEIIALNKTLSQVSKKIENFI